MIAALDNKVIKVHFLDKSHDNYKQCQQKLEDLKELKSELVDLQKKIKKDFVDDSKVTNALNAARDVIEKFNK